MIVVTGSSGHIGNVLVRNLVEQEEEVAIMTKTGVKPPWLNHLNIEVRKADLLSPQDVRDALSGAKVVFHLAGMISISSYDSQELYDVNVTGTQLIIDACKYHDVQRLIYTSSVHALPEGNKGEPITEESDFDTSKLFGAYSRTKAEATKRVLDAVNDGLDAVVCFPSGVMGPFDFRGSEAGKMISDYAGNKLPIYIDGEYNFVDVRDVVNGLLLAWRKGRKGEGYILGGEQMSLPQFFEMLNELHLPMKKPKFKMPLSVALTSAWLVENACRLIGAKPYFTMYAIKVLQSNCLLPSTKAKTELGYSHRPIKETLADSLKWLIENDKIT